jgi:hypothetical protein
LLSNPFSDMLCYLIHFNTFLLLNPFSEVFCYQINFQIRLQICLRSGSIVPDGACGKPPRRSEDGSDFRNFSDFRFQFAIVFG